MSNCCLQRRVGVSEDDKEKPSSEKTDVTFLGEKLMAATCGDAWVGKLMQAGREEGKKVMTRVVPEGSILFVPAGAIILEGSLNNKIGVGLGLSVLDSSTLSIQNMDILGSVRGTCPDASDKLAKRWQDVVAKTRK